MNSEHKKINHFPTGVRPNNFCPSTQVVLSAPTGIEPLHSSSIYIKRTRYNKVVEYKKVVCIDNTDESGL